MTTPTGLSDNTVAAIAHAMGQFPEIEAAILYGSRAKGNFRSGSDVDLVIKGRQVTDTIVKRLSAVLNDELPLPYFFDVVHYEAISNIDLVQHIDRAGMVMYRAAVSDQG